MPRVSWRGWAGAPCARCASWIDSAYRSPPAMEAQATREANIGGGNQVLNVNIPHQFNRRRARGAPELMAEEEGIEVGRRVECIKVERSESAGVANSQTVQGSKGYFEEEGPR